MGTSKFVVPAMGVMAFLGFIWWAPQPMRAADVERVIITNFPSVQNIQGAVTIAEPVPLARLERHSAFVDPVSQEDVSLYTEVGVLEAGGFSRVVLSLAGEIGGRVTSEEILGAVLIPDEPEILRQLTVEGRLQFPIRVEARAFPSAKGVFWSEQPSFRLAFPRYRIFFHSSRTAKVTLYAYLNNGGA